MTAVVWAFLAATFAGAVASWAIVRSVHTRAMGREREGLKHAKSEARLVIARAQTDIEQRHASLRRKAFEKLARREARLRERTDAAETRERELLRKVAAHESREAEVGEQIAVAKKARHDARRLQSKTKAARRIQLESLEQLIFRHRKEVITEEVAKRLEPLEHSIRKRATNTLGWVEVNAHLHARRIMALATDRYNGVGHLERVQNMIPINSQRTFVAIADPESAAGRALRADIACEFSVREGEQALGFRSDDSLAREIARRVLRQISNKGVTNPDKVHQIVKTTTDEITREVRNAGKKAVRVTEIGDVHPEIIDLVGRLKFRLSYSQNQWKHAVEVARLADMMARELGVDENLARRGGLLHDIGKAMTHDHDGSHAVLGAQVARRCGEDEIVANAIGSHHNDEPMNTPIAQIVTAADAISGARPGARREAADSYMERMAHIEEIAGQHVGVSRVDIMHGGREVRVVVDGMEYDGTTNVHDKASVKDDALIPLAEDIARDLEEQLVFPGQIKVTVIRESRATSVAH